MSVIMLKVTIPLSRIIYKIVDPWTDLAIYQNIYWSLTSQWYDAILIEFQVCLAKNPTIQIQKLNTICNGEGKKGESEVHILRSNTIYTFGQ